MSHAFVVPNAAMQAMEIAMPTHRTVRTGTIAVSVPCCARRVLLMPRVLSLLSWEELYREGGMAQ